MNDTSEFVSQPVNIVNKYNVLSTGPLDTEASSIINSIAAQDGMSLGEVVGFAPTGGGITQTPVGSFLPRMERATSSVDPGEGVIVGGDLDGVYVNGEVPVNSSDFPLASVVANRGNGIRVCTQGRCLALVDGQTNGAIGVGDELTTNDGMYVKQGGSEGLAPKAIALQATSSLHSVIAVDIQRQGTAPTLSGFTQLVTIASANLAGSTAGQFQVLVSITGNTGLIANGSSSLGFDLFFTDEKSSVRFPYERQSYSQTSGNLIAWVLVPPLVAGLDTKFQMHYGGDNSKDQQQIGAVWSTTFNQVYHLSQTNPLPYLNSVISGPSTFGNINGSFGDPGTTSITGQIGNGSRITAKGFSFNADSSTTFVRPLFTGMTWLRKDTSATTTTDFLEYFNTNVDAGNLRVSLTSGAGSSNIDDLILKVVDRSGTGADLNINFKTLPDTNFHFVGFTINSTQIEIIFDDEDFMFSNPNNLLGTVGPIAIGGGLNDGTLIVGGLDEVKYVGIDLGVNFLKNSFLNQKVKVGSGNGQGDDGFISMGPQIAD